VTDSLHDYPIQYEELREPKRTRTNDDSIINNGSHRCKATVHKPDTYRRTGRGRTGFEMHYTESRCARRATHDGYCWQHKGRS
jgi:hypothetical protein